MCMPFQMELNIQQLENNTILKLGDSQKTDLLTKIKMKRNGIKTV